MAGYICARHTRMGGSEEASARMGQLYLYSGRTENNENGFCCRVQQYKHQTEATFELRPCLEFSRVLPLFEPDFPS